MLEPLEQEVAELIIETLALRVDLSDIKTDTALFSEGLGLDSIDILELAMVISKKYGVQLRASDRDNPEIFASVGSLSAFIKENRTA
jgi:acyl carrier protein